MIVNIQQAELHKIIRNVVQRDTSYSGVIFKNDLWTVVADIYKQGLYFKVAVSYKNGVRNTDVMSLKLLPNGYKLERQNEAMRLTIAVKDKISDTVKIYLNVKDEKIGASVTYDDVLDYQCMLGKNGSEFVEIFDTSAYAGFTYIEDCDGLMYLYIGKFDKIQINKPRGNIKSKIGFVGENEHNLINIDVSNKHLYIPLDSIDILDTFRNGIRYGIVKTIENHFKAKDTRYLSKLITDSKIYAVRAIEIYGILQVSDFPDMDYNMGTYNGKGDKNILRWYWKLNLAAAHLGGVSDAESEYEHW